MTASVVAFGVAALAIVVLAFVAALSIAWAQERVADRLRAGTRSVKRWGGVVMAVVGAWFVVLAAFPETFARLFPV